MSRSAQTDCRLRPRSQSQSGVNRSLSDGKYRRYQACRSSIYGRGQHQLDNALDWDALGFEPEMSRPTDVARSSGSIITLKAFSLRTGTCGQRREGYIGAIEVQTRT